MYLCESHYDNTLVIMTFVIEWIFSKACVTQYLYL